MENDKKQPTCLNKLNWYCVKWMCFRIYYSASSDASKAVRSLCTAMHTQSCFVIQYFPSWWEKTISNPNCFGFAV